MTSSYIDIDKVYLILMKACVEIVFTHLQFNPNKHIETKGTDFVLKPSTENGIHCGIIVLDASVEKLTEEMIRLLHKIQSFFDEKGTSFLKHLYSLSEGATMYICFCILV